MWPRYRSQMAGYPSEYELDVALRDGGGARIRPIKPDDGPLLVDFFERLGPESRYFRFFRIKETLEPKEVEFFTHVDYSDRMALVALLDRARQAGAVRSDVDLTDLALLLVMLCTVADVSARQSPYLWRRYLPTMLASLRPDGPDLPVPALTEAELVDALQKPRAATRGSRP